MKWPVAVEIQPKEKIMNLKFGNTQFFAASAHAVALFALAYPNLASSEIATDAAPPTVCQAICTQYQNAVLLDQDQAKAQNCSTYISPLSNDAIVKVRLWTEKAIERGFDKTVKTAIDDVLTLRVGGADVWSTRYRSMDATVYELKKSKLSDGCNSIGLQYINYGGDGHFLAKLGGRAFCGTDVWCREYDEGQTFGSLRLVNSKRCRRRHGVEIPADCAAEFMQVSGSGGHSSQRQVSLTSKVM